MTPQTQDTALLVMDVQPGVLERLGDGKDEYLARAKAVVEEVRRRGGRVFHVVVGFRPGMPEISANNKGFSTLSKATPSLLTDPRPAITPEGTDVVVTKRRVSAFSGSDLDVLLRAGRIGHLVLCGIATSGVVLSTLREAADKDYRLTVLSDLCADRDPEVHAVLINKLFPRQAEVMTSSDWLAGPSPAGG
jgi:nicotinamidase-related amidase